jgi:hypothetical protein
LQTPVVDAGLATPSGMSSVGGLGLETPGKNYWRKGWTVIVWYQMVETDLAEKWPSFVNEI